MADQVATPSAADQDTRTRKTVRLHTIQPAAPEPPKTENIIRDPLAARDTDTGNLEILSDTQTRRTLKLKPIAPGARPAVQLNITPDNSDTTTRKTVLLKPVTAEKTPAETPAPAVHKTIPMPQGMTDKKAPTLVLPESPVAQANSAVSSNSVVKPATVVLSSSPAAAVKSVSSDVDIPPAPKAAVTPKPAEPKEEVSDNTAAVPRAAKETSDEEDQTVKLKRPLKLAPPPVSAPGEDQKATVKLPPPKLPSLGLKPPTAVPPAPKVAVALKPQTPAVPVPAPEPAPTAAAPAKNSTPADEIKIAPLPAESSAAPKAEDEKKKNNLQEEPETIELVSGIKQEQEKEQRQNAKKEKMPKSSVSSDIGYGQQPSVLYLILTAAALIFVVISGVISSTQYLDFCHGKKIYDAVPGLPIAK